jgi:hypothetical protein
LLPLLEISQARNHQSFSVKKKVVVLGDLNSIFPNIQRLKCLIKLNEVLELPTWGLCDKGNSLVCHSVWL